MSSRPGKTEKISISVNREDLALLRRRAKRLHGGNLSAVIAEVIARAKEQDGLENLLEWLGGPAPMTKESAEAIDRELLGHRSDARPARKRKRRAA